MLLPASRRVAQVSDSLRVAGQSLAGLAFTDPEARTRRLDVQQNPSEDFSFKGVAPDERALEGQVTQDAPAAGPGPASPADIRFHAEPSGSPAVEVEGDPWAQASSVPVPGVPVQAESGHMPPAPLPQAYAMNPLSESPESYPPHGEPYAPLPHAPRDVQNLGAGEVLADASPEIGAVEPMDPCQVNLPREGGQPERKQPKVSVEVEGEAPGAGSGLSPRHQVQAWLAQMVESQASDLILRSGGRPSQRLDGRISFLPGVVPGPGPMLEVLKGILGERRMEVFEEQGAADAALDLDGLGRFRINAYKQMGEPAIVIRRINEDAPSLDDLNLPAQELKDLALRKRGLVLVTGVAGSGKSTTLSAMIEFMNRNVERHVVTLEDPVELIFKERYCVISQREVGTDTTSFKQGLKHALRQSPDVIFIGEIRDAETVLAALEAIETGHLVMSTMHTVNAAQTVDRILGFFPAERHVQIRQRMADTLAGVLSMRLVPRIGGGQVPAYELMQCTPQVRELLEEGKTTELGRVIEGGMEPGLVAFNDRLLDLVQSGMVDLEDAIQTSDRPDELIMMMRGIQGGTRAQAKAAVSGPADVSGETPRRRRSDQDPASGSQGGPSGGTTPSQGQAPPPASGSGSGSGSGLRLRGTGPGQNGSY